MVRISRIPGSSHWVSDSLTAHYYIYTKGSGVTLPNTWSHALSHSSLKKSEEREEGWASEDWGENIFNGPLPFKILKECFGSKVPKLLFTPLGITCQIKR